MKKRFENYSMMKDICRKEPCGEGHESLTDNDKMAIISHYVHNCDTVSELPYWKTAMELIKE